MKRKRICLVATIPMVIKVFFSPHIHKLSTLYDITLVSNGPGDELLDLLGPRVTYVSLPIVRKISILKDLWALFKLYLFFSHERFSAVHSITPKAGLLVMAAARLAHIPVRIHTFTGQVWATRKGPFRELLKIMDRLMVLNSNSILCDSPSQKDFLVLSKIVSRNEINVLANGSFAGVDLNRFKPNNKERMKLRSALQLKEEDVLFLYVGRLSIDKGLRDLLQAFKIVTKELSNSKLLIVGPDEDGLESEVETMATNLPGRVFRVAYTSLPERYMAASDVFCLPSYREGFGSVLIEAAATQLPSIASRIYGITDAVEDRVTGILHRPRSVPEIAEAMALLAADRSLRLTLGQHARRRVVENFSEEKVTEELLKHYQYLFKSMAVRD